MRVTQVSCQEHDAVNTTRAHNALTHQQGWKGQLCNGLAPSSRSACLILIAASCYGNQRQAQAWLQFFNANNLISAATIHQCTDWWIAIFLSQYKYRYYNKMLRYYNIVILDESKIQHSEITVFYDSLPKSKPLQSQLLNKGTQKREKKFHLCFVLLCLLSVMHLSRWQHKSMCSSN